MRENSRVRLDERASCFGDPAIRKRGQSEKERRERRMTVNFADNFALYGRSQIDPHDNKCSSITFYRRYKKLQILI